MIWILGYYGWYSMDISRHGQSIVSSCIIYDKQTDKILHHGYMDYPYDPFILWGVTTWRINGSSWSRPGQDLEWGYGFWFSWWLPKSWIVDLRWSPWVTLWLCQNSYWKWPFIVDFPIKHGDFPVRYVSLPEGKTNPSSWWNVSMIFRGPPPMIWGNVVHCLQETKWRSLTTSHQGTPGPRAS